MSIIQVGQSLPHPDGVLTGTWFLPRLSNQPLPGTLTFGKGRQPAGFSFGVPSGSSSAEFGGKAGIDGGWSGEPPEALTSLFDEVSLCPEPLCGPSGSFASLFLPCVINARISDSRSVIPSPRPGQSSPGQSSPTRRIAEHLVDGVHHLERGHEPNRASALRA